MELIDEINLDAPDFEVLDFKMQGQIVAKFNNGIKYNLIFLITCVPEGFLVNALKHKPLSEYWKSSKVNFYNNYMKAFSIDIKV